MRSARSRRLAILAVLEFAGLHSPRAGGADISQHLSHRLALTHIVLSFQAELIARAGARLAQRRVTMLEASTALHEQVVRNRLAHNTEHLPRNAMGRIYALGFVPAVWRHLRPGLTPTLFFQRYLGIEPGPYLLVALMAAAFQGRSFDPEFHPGIQEMAFDPQRFFDQVRPPLRAKLEEFIALATQPAANLGLGVVSATTLEEVLYAAASFYSKPILRMPTYVVCVSPSHLLNKFAHGLVHLIQDRERIARGAPLPNDFVETLGGEFGEIFEGYVRWLFERWFQYSPQTRLEFSYRIPSATTGGTPPERDILVIRGDSAFLFEVKSKPVSLGLRRGGSISELDKLFLPPAIQCQTAAESLRAGTARTSTGTEISGIRFVVPCAIVWDFVPMAGPLSLAYERHLATEVGVPIFRERDGIAPLQFISLDSVEGWDGNCDFSPGSGDLFGALYRRARDEGLRHAPMQPAMFVGAPVGNPRPVDENGQAAMAYTQRELPQHWVAASP